MPLNFCQMFHHFNNFQDSKMKYLLIINFILITSALGKCPEDPLDCLIRSEMKENKLDTDTPSQEGSKISSNEASLDGPEIDLSSDGRFSLNDTQPVGCGEDQTQSTQVGKYGGCKTCSVCPKNGLLLRKCSSTQDTQCVCGKGSYLNVMNYECKACSSCPHGFGVWRQCNRNRNTVCRKCPPGTFSGVLSGTLGCVLCSTCRSDQVMLQECSRIQDTVCVDKSISERNYFASVKQDEEVISENKSSVPRKDHPTYHHNSYSLIIYFSFLVIIVCGLVFHVLLKWRLGKRLKEPTSPVLPINSSHYRHPYNPNHSYPNKNGYLYTQYINCYNNRYNNYEMHPFILAAAKDKNCSNCNLLQTPKTKVSTTAAATTPETKVMIRS